MKIIYRGRSCRERYGVFMKFTKMHGCGNDYVYVNCMKKMIEDPAKVSRFVSDRHFGTEGRAYYSSGKS